MRRTVAAALLVALAVVAAGCGGDETTETSTATTAVEAPPATTTGETTPEATPPVSKPRTIVIVVDQGRPRGGIKRPTLERGSEVVLVVRADAGESIHVHGYDIERPVRPGKPTRIALEATLAGRFEVELHHPDALLAVLEVRP